MTPTLWVLQASLGVGNFTPEVSCQLSWGTPKIAGQPRTHTTAGSWWPSWKISSSGARDATGLRMRKSSAVAYD